MGAHGKFTPHGINCRGRSARAPARVAGRGRYTARRPRIQTMTSTATDASATTVKTSVTVPTMFINIIQSNGCDGLSEYRTGTPPLFNHCHLSILDAPQLSSARTHSTNDTIKRRRRGRMMRGTTQVDHAIGNTTDVRLGSANARRCLARQRGWRLEPGLGSA